MPNQNDDYVEPVDNSLDDGDLIPRPEQAAVEWVPTEMQPFPTFKCTKIRKDGTKCDSWGITGMLPDNAKCVKHGGEQLTVRQKAAARVEVARMQVTDNLPMAVKTVIDLMGTGTADNIRLKAAESIMDRAGLRAGVEIDVTGEVKINSAEEVKEKLKKLLESKIVYEDPDEDDEDIIDVDIEPEEGKND